MKIVIESIPHKDQRYPTCGDWFIRQPVSCPSCEWESQDLPTVIECPICKAQISQLEIKEELVIRVSEEMGPDSCFLVALHELFEAKVAMKRGVTVKQVDDFDNEYEKAHRAGGTLDGERLDDTEPGDDPKCPVFLEHGVATAIENIACVMMGIPWPEHAARVMALP